MASFAPHTTVKDKTTGKYIPITQMDDQWLGNLIKYIERMDQAASSAIYPNLLAEQRRRASSGIKIARPNTVTTTGIPVTQAQMPADSLGRLLVETTERGHFGIERIGEIASVYVTGNDGASMTRGTIDRVQAVTVALKLLELFNEDDILSVIMQQANRQATVEVATQVQGVQRQPVMAEEDVW